MTDHTFKRDQIVTPKPDHRRHGMPFRVVNVIERPALTAQPGSISAPARPAVPAHSVVVAVSITHPQTIGALHMTPGGWRHFDREAAEPAPAA